MYAMHDDESIDLSLRSDAKRDEQIAGENTSEFGGSFFNFVNSIVGAGIIGLPYAFHHTGFGFGIILLTLVGYITYFSVNILVASGNKVRAYSYESVMQHAFGQKGVLLIIIAQFLVAFGAMLAYIVVIGDTMPELVRSFDEDNALTNRQLTCFLYSTFFDTSCLLASRYVLAIVHLWNLNFGSRCYRICRRISRTKGSQATEYRASLRLIHARGMVCWFGRDVFRLRLSA